MRVQRAPLDESVTLRFPKPLLGRMDEVADRRGYNRSALIRQAVREYLEAR